MRNNGNRKMFPYSGRERTDENLLSFFMREKIHERENTMTKK